MSSKNKRQRTLDSRARRKASAAAGPSAKATTAPPMDPPFGYRKAEGNVLEPDEDEVAAIERMRELATKRQRPEAIARKLNEEKITARGGPWDARSVTRVLRRRVAEGVPGRGAPTTSPRDGDDTGAVQGAS